MRNKSSLEVSIEQEVQQVNMGKPHVVILGATTPRSRKSWVSNLVDTPYLSQW